MPDLAPPQVPSERSSLVRIPFRDVDMHGHVHNAMFLSYFEAAINDFLRDKGLAAHFSPGSASCTYHVKKAELTFESPAFFEDALDIQIRIVRIGRSSLVFSGNAYRVATASLCAKAEIVWVCVDARLRCAIEIPSATRTAIEKWLM